MILKEALRTEIKNKTSMILLRNKIASEAFGVGYQKLNTLGHAVVDEIIGQSMYPVVEFGREKVAINALSIGKLLEGFASKLPGIVGGVESFLSTVARGGGGIKGVGKAFTELSGRQAGSQGMKQLGQGMKTLEGGLFKAPTKRRFALAGKQMEGVHISGKGMTFPEIQAMLKAQRGSKAFMPGVSGPGVNTAISTVGHQQTARGINKGINFLRTNKGKLVAGGTLAALIATSPIWGRAVAQGGKQLMRGALFGAAKPGMGLGTKAMIGAGGAGALGVGGYFGVRGRRQQARQTAAMQNPQTHGMYLGYNPNMRM